MRQTPEHLASSKVHTESVSSGAIFYHEPPETRWLELDLKSDRFKVSGFPFTPQVGSNRSGDGNVRNPDRPSVNPSFAGPVLLESPNRWFNPNAFVLPTPGTYGNLGRGVFTGPGLATVDLSLFKTTALSERVSLQFRAESFNLFNRSNFGAPNPIVFSGGAVNSSAGLITNTTTMSRQIQFGLKLIF